MKLGAVLGAVQSNRWSSQKELTSQQLEALNRKVTEVGLTTIKVRKVTKVGLTATKVRTEPESDLIPRALRSSVVSFEPKTRAVTQRSGFLPVDVPMVDSPTWGYIEEPRYLALQAAMREMENTR